MIRNIKNLKNKNHIIDRNKLSKKELEVYDNLSKAYKVVRRCTTESCKMLYGDDFKKSNSKRCPRCFRDSRGIRKRYIGFQEI